MVTQYPTFYVIDDVANYALINARTQNGVLYFERDTGRCKLGNGSRWNEAPYYDSGIDVDIDKQIHELIGAKVSGAISQLSIEPRIVEKRTAFNRDFGRTPDTIAPGDHTHTVQDITNLTFPENISFPSKPKGYILYDNKKFEPIPISHTPQPKDNSPISSYWAYDHEKSKTHLTPDQLHSLHKPLTTNGPGLSLDNQTLSLKIGNNNNELAPGNHAHDDYALKSHRHENPIHPFRLPPMTRDNWGAVPPTGNPTGRCLHDDGLWKHPSTMSIIQLTNNFPFWVSPAAGTIILASVSSTNEIIVNFTINNSKSFQITTKKTKSHKIYNDTLDVNIPIKKGDVLEGSSNEPSSIQIGVIINR